MIKSEDRDFWQSVANKKALDYPHVGRKITVVDGRKHKGKTGIVRQHRIDRYSTAFRYGNDASHYMRDMAGREGFVVLIDTGLETFWVKASYCLCEGRAYTPEQNYFRWCKLCEKKSKELNRSLTEDETTVLWKEAHQ